MARSRMQVGATQSPLNAQRWAVTLDCGHWIWVTAKRKPKDRVMRGCADCPSEDPKPRAVKVNVVATKTPVVEMLTLLKDLRDWWSNGSIPLAIDDFNRLSKCVERWDKEARSDKSIDELIAASSFGTPGAVAVRAAGVLGAALNKFEQGALEGVKGAEQARVVQAIEARAASLETWMRELPIGSEKRKELSHRVGQLSDVASGIRSGAIFLPPGK